MTLSSLTPLEVLLRERLAEEGKLTFARFMDLVLHEPDLGYYATQAVLGPEGDYVTSPELHPAFGALLGRQIEDCWLAMGRPAAFRVREVGAGTGALARDMLLWAQAAAPDLVESLIYEIVERSPKLRQRQEQSLARSELESLAVVWTSPACDARLTGCVLSNELLDSFPVHLVTMRDGQLLERYVAMGPNGPRLVDDAPSTPELRRYFERLGVWPGEGCQAEVNLEAVRWMGTATTWLERGLLITLDYGYAAQQLYAPGRRHGTLLCYYRHTLNSQPLERIGRQDITSHVDFTTLAAESERHGLGIMGLLSQLRALTNLGLPLYLERLGELPPAEREPNRRAMLALVDPDGLGRVGVLLGQRGLAEYVPPALRPGAPPPSTAYLPRLAADALRVPSPADLDQPAEFLAMWRAFVTGDESGLDEPGGG